MSNPKVKCNLKGFFVCDDCRKFCPNAAVCEVENFPRKQVIGCLGDFCDKPCDLKHDKDDVTKEQLIQLILYLGNEINKQLTGTVED